MSWGGGHSLLSLPERTSERLRSPALTETVLSYSYVFPFAVQRAFTWNG